MTYVIRHSGGLYYAGSPLGWSYRMADARPFRSSGRAARALVRRAGFEGHSLDSLTILKRRKVNREVE